MTNHTMENTGKVWLIGAGPGDPELLTMKAVRAIGAADVLLLDDLVNREVLQYAAAGARVIEVGKRGGCRSTPQAFIEKLMVRLARAGRRVARVKGGDPFVFGRGGEEAGALRQAGIEVEILSGITAGIGAPAALGIPVTHRGLCDGVTFVTGHTGDGRAPDWAALARTRTTLVVYMGVAQARAIATALVAGGMSAATPAAAIQNATLPAQACVTTTLANLAADMAAAGIGSPAVLVIGEVARLGTEQTAALVAAA
jgi:uroporphyrin-III C-methyltransferase